MKLSNSDPASKLRYICNVEGGLIINCSEQIILMNNGVEWYFVEVMSSSDTKYGIYAHGHEAIELFQETTNMLRVQALVDSILAVYD
jgi:hypothetical protein